MPLLKEGWGVLFPLHLNETGCRLEARLEITLLIGWGNVVHSLFLSPFLVSR